MFFHKKIETVFLAKNIRSTGWKIIYLTSILHILGTDRYKIDVRYINMMSQKKNSFSYSAFFIEICSNDIVKNNFFSCFIIQFFPYPFCLWLHNAFKRVSLNGLKVTPTFLLSFTKIQVWLLKIVSLTMKYLPKGCIVCLKVERKGLWTRAIS
jgi:hypothetical protein